MTSATARKILPLAPDVPVTADPPTLYTARPDKPSPPMKDAYYFSHDANARNDEKILELRSEFGWMGYGLFWAIIETLRDAADYRWRLDRIGGLAMSLSTPVDELRPVIDRCLALELFESDGETFYSPSLVRRMDRKREISEARAEAARKRGGKGPQDAPPPSDDDAPPEQSSSNGGANAEQLQSNTPLKERKGNKGNETSVCEDARTRESTVTRPIEFSDPSVYGVRTPDGSVILNSATIVDAALPGFHVPLEIRPAIVAWVETHDNKLPGQHDCNAIHRRCDDYGIDTVTLAIRKMGNAGKKSIDSLDAILMPLAAKRRKEAAAQSPRGDA